MPSRSPDGLPGWALALLATLAVASAVLVFGLSDAQQSIQDAHAQQAERDARAAAAAQGAQQDANAADPWLDEVGRTGDRIALDEINPFTHEVEFGWIGVVVDESGAPVPGVAVGWTVPWNASEHGLPVTDAQGRFALAFDPQANWPEEPGAGLVLRDPAWLPQVYAVHAPASPPSEVRLGAIPADTWLNFRVVESDGVTPRANLGVELSGPGVFGYARTDAEGRARLAGKADARLYLDTFGPIFGWLNAPDPLVLKQGESEELLVEFEGTPNALELIAHDSESKRRLFDAKWYSFASEGVMSDVPFEAPDGLLSWRVELHASVSGYCLLKVAADGYVPTCFEWSAMPPTGLLSVPLIPAAAQDVELVLTRKGEPAAQELIQLGVSMPYFCDDDDEPRGSMNLGSYSGTEVLAEARTDARGSARISVPWVRGEPLPNRVHLYFEGQDDWFDTQLLGEQPWHIELEPATTVVNFRAIDADGEPVANLDLRLWIEGNDASPLLYAARTAAYSVGRSNRPYWAKPDHVGRTNRAGICRFEIPANTPFDWSPTPAPERGDVRSSCGLAAGVEHEILIEHTGDAVISGSLVQADGQPWDGRPVQARLHHLDGSFPTEESTRRPYAWASDTTENQTGAFRFEGVPPGQYRLSFYNFALKQAEQIVSPGQQDLRIEMLAMCRMRVEVADARTGARIRGEGRAQLHSDPNGFAWANLWNGEGTVEFAPGPAITLEVDCDGYRSKIVPMGDVLVPGSELSQRVELERGRVVRLQVTPAEAVEDGRFAGMSIRDTAGNEIADFPLGYRTRPGEIDVFHAPREAFQLWMLDRATREPIFKVMVPAAEGEPPASPETEERTVVQVRWPEALGEADEGLDGG